MAKIEFEFNIASATDARLKTPVCMKLLDVFLAMGGVLLLSTYASPWLGLTLMVAYLAMLTVAFYHERTRILDLFAKQIEEKDAFIIDKDGRIYGLRDNLVLMDFIAPAPFGSPDKRTVSLVFRNEQKAYMVDIHQFKVDCAALDAAVPGQKAIITTAITPNDPDNAILVSQFAKGFILGPMAFDAQSCATRVLSFDIARLDTQTPPTAATPRFQARIPDGVVAPELGDLRKNLAGLTPEEYFAKATQRAFESGYTQGLQDGVEEGMEIGTQVSGDHNEEDKEPASAENPARSEKKENQK